MTRVTEVDVVEPLAVWVDCEQGETTCTGGDLAAFMVRHDGGWLCPACIAEGNAWADDFMRQASGRG